MEKLLHLRLPSLVWIIITAIPLLIVAILTSCRTTKTTTLTKTTTHDSAHSNLHKIVNNVYIRDSIYIREKGDTVYQDRWHTEIRDSVIENTDTVRIVERDSIPYAVEVIVPGNSPVPPFYRWCTALFFVFVFVIVFVIYCRIRSPVRIIR